MEAQLVYFDSCMWISHFLQENLNERAQTVQQLIEQIENDGEVILVSYLVLLEVLEVMRKRIAERESYTNFDDDKKKEIKDKVQEKADIFLESISQLAKDRKVAFINSQEPLDKWLKTTYSIFKVSFGDVSTPNYISSGGKKNSPKCHYKGVGHYDIQHALTAKEFFAKDLHTFDQGFAELEDYPDFKGINFCVYK